MFLSKLKVAASSLAIGFGLFSGSVVLLGPGLRADGPLAPQGGPEASRAAASAESAAILTSAPASAPAPDEPDGLPAQPKPWETVVRIRILGDHSVGIGSGTIIHSTGDESIILTAAHHFTARREGASTTGFQPTPLDSRNGAGVASSLDGRAPPAKFPFEIKVDLFDGQLTGTRPARTRFLETAGGALVDYDCDRDVALVRIRPGRRLAASRIVPTSWKPHSGMQLLTVGCSDGHDATAWLTTITRQLYRPLAPRAPQYEAIECTSAPKEGRAGGGLFTTDGCLAGVCNYAEPTSDHGLYATQGSIYRLLRRNGLAFLYENAGVGDRNLDEQIRDLDELIQKETQKLHRWKALRQVTAESRSGSTDHSVPRSVVRGRPAVPAAGPTERRPDLADHERRLQDIEQKLDRALKLLERLERDRRSAQ